MQTTSILIADDHELTRESLAVLLGREPGIEVVGVAADGRSAISMAKSLQPTVAILDVSLPMINGIQVARQIRVDSPRTGLIMLSTHDRGEYLKEFMRDDSAGKAFLLKATLRNTRDIVRSIEDVTAGRTVLDPAMVSKLTSDDGVRLSGALKNLSPRELQVLGLMAKAHSNRAIAEALFIQPRTVERDIPRAALFTGTYVRFRTAVSSVLRLSRGARSFLTNGLLMIRSSWTWSHRAAL